MLDWKATTLLINLTENIKVNEICQEKLSNFFMFHSFSILTQCLSYPHPKGIKGLKATFWNLTTEHFSTESYVWFYWNSMSVLFSMVVKETMRVTIGQYAYCTHLWWRNPVTVIRFPIISNNWPHFTVFVVKLKTTQEKTQGTSLQNHNRWHG